MTLQPRTADDLSVALVRLMKSLGRSRHTLPSIHPKIDSSYVPTLYVIAPGPTRVTAVAERVHADASTVSRQVSTLVEHGLVRRIPDPKDGRAHLVELTSEGEGFLRDMKAVRSAWIADILADWSEQDGQVLTELLERFTNDVYVHLGLPPTQPAHQPQPATTGA